MTTRTRFRFPALALAAALAVGGGLLAADMLPATAGKTDHALAQTPLYMGRSEPPLMMMVMSRDERLFTKAYSDHTDLNDDGVLDTTYNDAFDYAGYFGPNTCYKHEGGVFTAHKDAEGHKCKEGASWSGNFLNWATMTRMDILRHVLYGGYRSSDGSSGTILERAHVPNDAHAWVKIYDGGDLASFVPGQFANQGAISICNASFGVDTVPVMRVVEGRYPEWAATSLYQCGVNKTDTGSGNDAPKSGHTDFTVRVKVCDSKHELEPFCREYPNNGSPISRPAGLLQEYGESGRLRFGLLTGSVSKPRSGGVLRRNIGKIAGNSTAQCDSGDEVDLVTGKFCPRAAGEEGIVNAVDRLKLDKWTGTEWSDCKSPGILNRTGSLSLKNPGSGDRTCSGWGNPVAEMYAEALRYVGGKPAGVFGADTALGLPNPAWKDPYGKGGSSYCADCNILVLSSGLSSFDSDEIPSDLPGGISARALTTEVGSAEGINGRQFLVGGVEETPVGANIATHSYLCSSKLVSDLGLVRGICPDTPTMEGSYLMAGLAKGAASKDLRPGLKGKPSSYKVTANTYAVQLADNLPKFEIPVSGGNITLAPLCQANTDGNAQPSSSGWRSCALLSVSIGPKTVNSPGATAHVIGRALKEDRSAGSFSLVWEDSMWGSDYDNDVVTMLSYCIGESCREKTNPHYDGPGICWLSGSNVCKNNLSGVGPNDVLVRVENMSMYAGHSMLTGLAVTGSNDDGVHRMVHMKGGFFESILTGNTTLTNGKLKAGWGAPVVLKLQRSASGGAGQLENPLWYSAKYGVKPGVRWDTRQPGVPDNYFFARDPSKLKEALGAIFEKAASGGGPTAGGGSGARIAAGSFTVEAGYDVADDTNDWVGRLRAFPIDTDGTRGTEPLWDAAKGIPAPDSRKIWTAIRPTELNDNGTVKHAVNSAEFKLAQLGENDAKRAAALGLDVNASWMKNISLAGVVNYLRGDRSLAQLRTRSSVLGDIVNSDVAISAGRDDYGYSAWKVGGGPYNADQQALGKSYEQFLKQRRERPTAVFVGANDGMLHGFNGTTGTELFGFIPNRSLRHIGELANPGYQHEYYVDGGLALGDVPAGATADWRTVLVGSTGAGGGKQEGGNTTVSHGSVFALDVSAPQNFGKASVLWELTGNDHSDLGFVLGRPHIVPILWEGKPRWVALFGNGPNSINGAPALFVADATTGALLDIAKPTDNKYADKNGLINIAPVDMEKSDGLVDVVYGGDLQGNIWKFELGTKPANPATQGWAAAFGGNPLFTATRDKAMQPITGHIEVSRGPVGGVTLFFGTGKYFAEGDNTSDLVQSLYSIWDRPGAGAISGRGSLAGQALTAGKSSNGHATREVTNHPVDYGAQRGWYVDLELDGSATGERFIGAPRLQSGKVIFTTYEPGGEICGAGGGINWQYALDLLSGGGAMSGVSLDAGLTSPVCEGDNCAGIALNGPDSPSAPVKSVSVFVPKPLRPGVGGGATPCDPADASCNVDEFLGSSKCTFVLHTPGAPPLYLPRPCGRQSWRQVL